MSDPALRRIVRRETHSPRTAAVTIVVLVAVAALVWVAVETARQLAGLSPWLASPAEMLAWAGALPAAEPRGAVIAGSAGVAVLGLVLLVIAFAPGRRARQELASDTHAVVVDNGVLASAVARRIAEEAGLRPDSVVVGVGHRAVDVMVRPETGLPVDVDAVREAARAELERASVTPPLTTRVRVARARERSAA
ncbi:DUF6286 domain-containing protein [Microbacterium gilvum]|uniref:DUF6286 domain-containing protein n=1 Tax=Microbacterium gilvum TaxID=1336204 RepID=A0ABP9A4S0_9MICO